MILQMPIYKEFILLRNRLLNICDVSRTANETTAQCYSYIMNNEALKSLIIGLVSDEKAYNCIIKSNSKNEREKCCEEFLKNNPSYQPLLFASMAIEAQNNSNKLGTIKYPPQYSGHFGDSFWNLMEFFSNSSSNSFLA